MGVADDKTRIVLTVSKDLKSKLDLQAQKENRSVSNLINMLINDYIIKAEEIEQQSYLNLLANYYLSNNINYTNCINELMSQGFNFANFPPDQVYNYVKGYFIANYKNTLLQYGVNIGLTFEKFIQSQQPTTTTRQFGWNNYVPNNNYNYPFIQKD